MTGTARFFVEGTPAPQGSKVRTRHGMRESSKRVKPWRDHVRAEAEALNLQMKPPYEVALRFRITRPKSTNAEYPVAPTVGDIDKLVRAVNDALTQSHIIDDDRHIVFQSAEKRWTERDEKPGVMIYVSSLAKEN